MQNQNSTSSSKPKAGDGTQQEEPSKDANWYGASQEPQEEFVENSPAPPTDDGWGERTSEGQPTMGGANDPHGPESSSKKRR